MYNFNYGPPLSVKEKSTNEPLPLIETDAVEYSNIEQMNNGSETERSSAGSSEIEYSSDGSSFYEEYSGKEMIIDGNHSSTILSVPFSMEEYSKQIPSEFELKVNGIYKEMKTRMLEAADGMDEVTFRQTIVMGKYRKDEYKDTIDLLEMRVEKENRMKEERIEKIKEVMNDIEMIQLAFDKGQKAYEQARESHLGNLLDENVMQSNTQWYLDLLSRFPKGAAEQIELIDTDGTSTCNTISEVEKTF